MCVGGGGGGGDGGAAQRETDRKAAQDAGIAKVNNLFGVTDPVAAAKRQALYDQVGADARASMQNSIAGDQANAQKNIQFNLARAGLFGGSEELNQAANFDRAKQAANLQIEGKANDLVTGMRTADNAAKNSAISNIVSGMNAGAVIDNALTAQNQNLANAKASANIANAGQLFGGFGDQYNAYNQSILTQRTINGQNPAAQVANPNGKLG